MAVGPFVVGVSELRRRLADLIEEVGGGEHPLFITQHGLVTAVLISRDQYRSWCPESEKRRHTEGEPRRIERDTRQPGVAPARPSAARIQRSPVVPTRRVWTQYGWCDFEIAQVLAEQGVETELVFTDEGWLTDDEG